VRCPGLPVRRPGFGAGAAGSRGVATVTAGAAGHVPGRGRDYHAHGGPGFRTAMRTILPVSATAPVLPGTSPRPTPRRRHVAGRPTSRRERAGPAAGRGRRPLAPAPRWSRYSPNPDPDARNPCSLDNGARFMAYGVPRPAAGITRPLRDSADVLINSTVPGWAPLNSTVPAWAPAARQPLGGRAADAATA
jgi:hypothetical protein